MAHTIQSDPGGKFVHVVYSDDVALEQILAASSEAWRLGNDEGMLRFLTEFSNARLNLSAQDLTEIDKYFDQLEMSREMKVAVVVPDEASFAREVEIFIYSANVNRWRAELFYNRAEAIAWLQE